MRHIETDSFVDFEAYERYQEAAEQYNWHAARDSSTCTVFLMVSHKPSRMHKQFVLLKYRTYWWANMSQPEQEKFLSELKYMIVN